MEDLVRNLLEILRDLYYETLLVQDLELWKVLIVVSQMDMPSLRDIDWKYHWDHKFDLHW